MKKTAEEIIDKYPSRDEHDEYVLKTDAIEAMHEYANQSRWISVAVEKRLPEPIYNDSCKLYEIRVIVSVKNKVFEGYFASPKKNDVLAEFVSVVDHWQPLPDKPTELREEEP